LEASALRLDPVAARRRGVSVARIEFSDAGTTACLATVPSSCVANRRKLGMVEEEPTATNTIIPNKTNRLHFTVKRSVLIDIVLLDCSSSSYMAHSSQRIGAISHLAWAWA
jgi:hypothetical protein